MALCLSALLGLLALAAGTAGAATPGAAGNDVPSFGGPATPELQNKVTFIGDSVTAGFGFCGYSENAANVKCPPNQEMADRWAIGDNSLNDCKPPAKGAPTDACSNNNMNGKPWEQGPWEAGQGVPDIAYPFQLAAKQTGPEKAEVSDWALTGSIPADWDSSGPFGFLIPKLKDQYVGMTLGANPLLAAFTSINFNIPLNIGKKDVVGDCVDSTSSGVAGRYSGEMERPLDCLRSEWNQAEQTRHLVSLYKQLLAQNDRVVVMGYYRSCSWSFGDWQSRANSWGPSAGNDCKGQIKDKGFFTFKTMSQWEQATAVGAELNNLIQNAVDKAKEEAKKEWPGTGRDDNIVFTTPNGNEWEQHQPTSGDSWVLKNDTWIHPNKAGDTNLAKTVADAMCSHFDHWCGSDWRWSK